jgi:hypothetical protein
MGISGFCFFGESLKTAYDSRVLLEWKFRKFASFCLFALKTAYNVFLFWGLLKKKIQNFDYVAQ